MTIEVATAQYVGFLLAMVRTAAWLAFCPPFNTRTVPATVKAGLAVGLALPIAPRVATQVPSLDTAPLVGAIVMQVLIGVALGFATNMIFVAVQAAGNFIDLFGGFALAAAFDPLSMQQSSIFGRFYGQMALILLFVINGHLLLLKGFYTSFEAIPVDALVSTASLGRVMTVGIAQFFLAALQIAAPMMGVFFLVDIGLGLLTKVSPMLNVFSLGFPAKILTTILLVGAALPMLPEVIRLLTATMLRLTSGITGTG